ncbi:HEAT repeat domain-containing protein [Thalassiella azotivora]
MNASAVLGLTLLVLAGLLLLLAVVVAGRRAHRLRAERRRQAAAEPLRPLLLTLAAGEPDEAREALETLVRLDARRWAAVEPTVEGLLLKLRGDTHAAVVELLERRGTLATALAATTSRSVVRRAHGAEVLGAAGHPGALPELLRLLQDGDPEVRQVAARALGRVGDARGAAPLLATLAGSLDVPPRIVATAIMRMGAAAHPALVDVLHAGDPLQRAVAADIAGLSGAVDAAGTLIGLLQDDPELEVRVRCARAVGRIGLPAALPALLLSVDDDQPGPLRTVATRALGDLGHPRAVPRLTELVTDRDHRVAGNAAVALSRCGPQGLRALRQVAARPAGVHARDALATAALRGLHADDDPAAGAPSAAASSPLGARP